MVFYFIVFGPCVDVSWLRKRPSVWLGQQNCKISSQIYDQNYDCIFFPPRTVICLGSGPYMLFLLRIADEYVHLALRLFWITGLDSIEFTHQLWFAFHRERQRTLR